MDTNCNKERGTSGRWQPIEVDNAMTDSDALDAKSPMKNDKPAAKTQAFAAKEHRRGRPKKAIDSSQVAKLAALGATVEEMADFFAVDSSTLHRNFATFIDKGRAALRLKLRRLQIRSAERGSVLMQIYLGKVLLGQREDGMNGEVPNVEVFVNLDEPEPYPQASESQLPDGRLGGE